VDRSPPPFFKQGYSANARLAFFALLAVTLLVVDARMQWLTALRQGIGTVLYPVQRTLLVPRDALSMGLQYFADVDRLRSENGELRRVEIANARTLLLAEQLQVENARLRELLGARERAAVRSVIAEVLYEARDPFSRRVVLDKGLQSGVLAGQPVIDAQGVIGQVTRVFPLSSEVTLLSDRNATIPVEVQRTGQRAIAFGGVGGGLIELRYLPGAADLKENDLLVTSGLDSLYPAGIPVGRVRELEKAGSGAFSRVLVQPVGGLERSRTLLVPLVDRDRLPPPPPPPEATDGRRGRKGG